MNRSEEISVSENRFADEIGRAITGRIYPGSACRRAELVGCDRDYWSVILVYEITKEQKPREVRRIYCKIPKANWNITTIGEILRGDFETSKEMAETEFNSLNHLRAGFERCPDRSLRVINPLGYLSEYNAVFTEGVHNSTEVFELLRPWGNQSRINSESLAYLRKIGKWLGYFHAAGRDKGANGFKRHSAFPDQLRQMRDAAGEIGDKSLADRLVRYIDELSNKASFDPAYPDTLTIEGFEVRNFITDGEAVFFLDPGRINAGSAYEDLARFIASLSILYWGRINFLREYRNEETFIGSFIASYEDESGGIERDILNLYLAKQFIRLWIDGILVLRHKRYMKPLDSVVQRLYIERFFTKRLNQLLSAS
jgi:hypothetical protein